MPKHTLELIGIAPKPQRMDVEFDAIMDRAQKQVDLALAAPDLYEMVLALVSLVPEDGPEVHAAVKTRARALIAKHRLP